MSSVLAFERHQAEINRQILRRIGYTNGLHRIRRFTRVVEYVFDIVSTSRSLLVQTIIEREAQLERPDSRKLTGPKYVQGIIDVAVALGLLERFGPKIALSSEGYACHCLSITDGAESRALDAFLFRRIVACDGEYSLNVLQLAAEGKRAVVDVGVALLERFLRVIAIKEAWAETIANSFAKRIVSSLLKEARQKLLQSIDNASQSADFFYKHTAAPRIEWLVDLGLLTSEGDQLLLSAAGAATLAEIRRQSLLQQDVIVLPLDDWLRTELALPSQPVRDAANWDEQLCAAAYGPSVVAGAASYPDDQGLLETLYALYEHVKLQGFNEADVLSAFEVLAARSATSGHAMDRTAFEDRVRKAIAARPADVFKLTKRRGHGFYFAFKRAPTA